MTFEEMRRIRLRDELLHAFPRGFLALGVVDYDQDGPTKFEVFASQLDGNPDLRALLEQVNVVKGDGICRIATLKKDTSITRT